MIEMISRLSPFTADQFLLSILMLLLVIIGVPLAVSFYVNKKRRKKRTRAHSPRRIELASDESVARACEHLRSKSRAKESADGQMVSVCKKCGVRMVRSGPGEWLA